MLIPSWARNNVSDVKWKLFNLWGPFLGAGIRLDRVSSDFREVDVSMKLHFWNANYLGTHYGGSLYSMTDPFYVVMMVENLGPNYIVLDKSAKIRFLRPERGRVFAKFRLTEEMLIEVRTRTEGGKSVEPVFSVQIINREGTVVAEVEKTVYVRRRGGTNTSAPTG
jgi:hypothetical protein